ncbi:hypothetical protein BKA62DRAFT_671160 [Auriculariales sp. MPI-PUGE-AT-0066]|nr:hypothetical protein BKA62DRAFT_671160 [Auriculariales sp. MPI-PUGE-AT-0066]
MGANDVKEPLSVEVLEMVVKAGRSVVDFALDEASDVDVADGLVNLEAKVTLREVSRAPRVLEALLLEVRGRLAVDGLRIEVRAGVVGHDAVEYLARGRRDCELDGCADTEEDEDKGEVEDTRVSVERAGEVEEEMVEGTKARRTTAIAVGVGGVGGTKNSTK